MKKVIGKIIKYKTMSKRNYTISRKAGDKCTLVML